MARDLVVRLIGDSRSLERSLQRSERSVKRFQANISGRGVAGGLTAVYGARATYQFLKNSVAAASNLAEQTSKTNLVFRENAAEIKKWAGTSAQSMGLAEDQALQTASSFGALLRPLGVTGDEAARQSQRLTQLGADLASFYNTDVQSALDAIRSGLVGEAEPLRRYGALLSETRVQQEAMRQTGKENATQLTQTDKVLARIQLTFKDTAQAQGNFALTSEESANQLRTLEANVRNLSTTIGGKLLPALTFAAGAINDAFAKADFGALAELQRQIDRGVYTLGRSRDRIESLRAGRVFADQGVGLTGGATAGRRASAAATRAMNRQTLERNRWFDAMVGRRLDRVQDVTPLRAQIGRLREAAKLVRERLAITKDITRRHALEDQLLGIQRDIRDRQQTIQEAATRRFWEQKRAAQERARMQTERRFGWLEFGIERAEATEKIPLIRRALRAKEKALEEVIASEGRNLERSRELWRTREAIRDLNKTKELEQVGFRQRNPERLAEMLGLGGNRRAIALLAGIGKGGSMVTGTGQYGGVVVTGPVAVYAHDVAGFENAMRKHARGKPAVRRGAR